MPVSLAPSVAPCAAPPLAPPTPGGTEPVYGVLQIGHALLAVALGALREVIPCPACISGLPASAPGLLGAVDVRGKVVPVLDLRVVLGLGSTDGGHAGHVVVLLRHQGRLLGLLAAGVRGLTQPAPGSIGQVSAEGCGLLFSGSFERAEDRSVVSVLDTEAVMRLPGIPVLHEDAPASRSSHAGPIAAPRHALMLVRCGAVGLALDVADIHTTLPKVTPHPSPLGGRVCRGVIDHADRRLPAIDPLALMELGTLPADAPCEALLLRHDAGWVALLVSAVIDIVRVAEADLLPLPPLAVRRPELFRAALNLPGRGVYLLLGSQALRDEPALRALAALNTLRAGAGPAATAGRAAGAAALASAAATAVRGDPVLTYDIGVVVATRLSQVDEVLTPPADGAQLASAHPAVCGMFVHRRHSVTLVCLATLLGAAARPTSADARVLLVTQGSAHFGFVVPRLCHIENTRWERPPGSAPGDKPQRLGLHAVVELGEGDQRRTLHLVDLRALAASLQNGEAGGSLPPPLGEGAGGAARSSTVADAAPHPHPLPKEEREPIQKALSR